MYHKCIDITKMEDTIGRWNRQCSRSEEERKVQLPSFSWKTVQRWGLRLLVVALAILLNLSLFAAKDLNIWGHSLPQVIGASLVAIFILAVVSVWEQQASILWAPIGKWLRSSQIWIKIFCLLIFLPAFTIYILTSAEDGSVSATVQVGVIAVAIALGGLVLSAGLNRDGENGKKLILVAQKFIVVVILMFIFLPMVHIIDLKEGIDVSAFEPFDPNAWFRGLTFWVAAASFYAGTGLFVTALVDLAYAVFGLGGTEDTSYRKRESPDRNDADDGCGGINHSG